MKYAVWNNKGGVGKSFLTFVIGSEVARRNPDSRVLLVDMCPQANLSEIVLGGNGRGAENLAALCTANLTVGGYFDKRISSPHQPIGSEDDYPLTAADFNEELPENLWLLAGDPSLEIQTQAMNQIAGQTLPSDAWKNVHLWLRDLVDASTSRLGGDWYVFIDCNPSFAAYTELAMTAADRLIIPCSCDGSSARAIDNLGKLLYGIGVSKQHESASYQAKARESGLAMPKIHAVVLNRSTQYNKKASQAFAAMFRAIQDKVERLCETNPEVFTGHEPCFRDIPDAHSVAIICAHLGRPLSSIRPGRYEVYDTSPQVNDEPLDRYKEGVDALLGIL